MAAFPASVDDLVRAQEVLAQSRPPPSPLPSRPLLVAGCFACFPRGAHGPGSAGDSAWVAAAVTSGRRVVGTSLVEGRAGAPYEPGLLALREGELLAGAVRALPERPDVLLVDATARDHPRRAGLALHLGAELDLPTVGVTHRPLRAEGGWPDEQRGSTRPLLLAGEVVGCWLRTKRAARPLAVHPGWRTDLDTAVAVVLATATRARTPEPLRRARSLARSARSAAVAPGHRLRGGAT